MTLTVLHTESSKGWGGQENRTLKECIGLKKIGARMLIACQPDSVLAERGAEAGIDVKKIEMKSSISISAIVALLKIIRNESVNIVCTHSGKDSMLGAIAGRLSNMKPVIVRTRHLALPITSRFTYAVLPHRIVTVSEYVRRYLIEEKRIKPEKVVSIPTGIDIERFNPDVVSAVPREELGIAADAQIVGTVAILRRKKGHHILLDAIPMVLREFPKTIFLFAGDGPQRKNIEDKILELGIGNNVKLLGLRNDIPEILKTMAIFALPTLQEALGTSFLEAMAMGKPVVGTKVGGVGEVLKDGINGYLVEPGNPSVLAKAIIKLLKDKEKAQMMGIEGEKIVRQNYTVEKMCENMYAFYFSMLKMKNL